MRGVKQFITRCVFFIILFGLSNAVHSLEIIGFGDSITQGLQRNASQQVFANPNPLNGAANAGGYEPELNRLLDAGVSASTVYNWGIGGENTSTGVGRIAAVLNTRTVKYVLIMEGANDLMQGVSSSTTKANLSSMIDQSRARNVVPILASVTPNTVSSTLDTRIRDEYNPKIRQLASEKSVQLADMWTQIRPDWNGLHSGDRLHPNTTGYNRIAKVWFDVVDVLETKSSIIPILQLLLLD